MRTTPLVLMAALLLPACASRAPEPLPARAESYHWSAQPIPYVAPAEGAESRPYAEQGQRGILYELTEPVGARIIVSEYLPVAQRDRRSALRRLLLQARSLDGPSFGEAVHRARLPIEDPIVPEELELATKVNEYLASAAGAVERDDFNRARRLIMLAQLEAESFSYTLDQVIEPVFMRAERSRWPDHFEVLEERSGEIDGAAMRQLDYIIRGTTTHDWGREIYILANNHLFRLAYFGVEEGLVEFERLVSTVIFPPIRDWPAESVDTAR